MHRVSGSCYVMSFGAWIGNDVTPLFRTCFAYWDCNTSQDTIWWTVWLGWHTAEKISVVPKGWLNPVGNRVESARAKASLIGFITLVNPNTKVRPSELQCPP